jgi:hypothetical protein
MQNDSDAHEIELGWFSPIGLGALHVLPL